MAFYTIEISGEELETDSDFQFIMNAFVLDLENITKRGVSSSNNFIIANTGVNNVLLESPANTLINRGVQLETSFEAVVKEKGALVAQGRLFVKEIIRKKNKTSSFKCQFIDNSKNFYELINRPLFDLDTSEFDFVYNQASYDTLKSDTGSLFIWALSNMGLGVSNVLKDTRPMIKVNVLMNKIISETGYNGNINTIADGYAGDISNICETANHEDFKVSDFEYLFENKIFVGADIDYGDGTSQTANIFTSLVGGFPETSDVKQKWVIKGSITPNTNGAIIVSDGTRSEQKTFFQNDTFINFITDDFDPDSSIVISVEGSLKLNNVRVFNLVSELSLAEFYNLSDPLAFWETANGNGISVLTDWKVKADFNLPSLLQKTYFQRMITFYFAIVTTKDLVREIEFALLRNLSQFNAFDLTPHVLDVGSISGGNSFGKRNLMEYSNDTDEVSDTIGGFLFESPQKKEDTVKTFLKSFYSASLNVVISNVTYGKMKIYIDASADNRSNMRGQVSKRLFSIQNKSTTSIASFSFIEMNNIYSNYFESLIKPLLVTRIVPVEVLIDFTIFRQILRSVVVQIDGINGVSTNYFIVLNISKFSINTRTKITLARL